MGLQAEDALIIGCSIGGCLLLIAVIIIVTVIVQSRCCRCRDAGTKEVYQRRSRDSYTSDTYAKGMAQRSANGGVWMNNPSIFPNQDQANLDGPARGFNVDKLGSDWGHNNFGAYAKSAQSESSDQSINYGSRDRLVVKEDIRQESPPPRPASPKRQGNKKTLEPQERKAIVDAFQFLEEDVGDDKGHL